MEYGMELPPMEAPAMEDVRIKAPPVYVSLLSLDDDHTVWIGIEGWESGTEQSHLSFDIDGPALLVSTWCIEREKRLVPCPNLLR
jgi:hypothetical protein